MRLKYVPHEKQLMVHKALSPPYRGVVVMVIAGRRFGKTVLAVNEIIKRAIETPHARIWYLAPTKDQAYRIAWRVMLKYLPAELMRKKREDKHYIELYNDSLIEFLGTQEEIFLLGAGLHFVVFDEFPTIPYSVWFDTVKPMLADHNGDALFIGTVPDPKIHNITLEFLDMYDEIFATTGNTEEPRAFNFSSFDNPYISHEKLKKDIEELKRKGREADAHRLYFGKYTREYGLVFPLFSHRQHVVQPFEIPNTWTRVMAIDPHPQKPIYGLWCAIDPRGHHWFYREVKFEMDDGRPMTVPESAMEIIRIEGQAKEKVKARFIDPTHAKVEQKTLGIKSIHELYRRQGLFFKTANRDFNTFFHRFSDMLAEVPEPMVHIFQSCPEFIFQLKTYTWDSWASLRAREEKGRKDRPKKVNDDFIDCAKYIINANVKHVELEDIKAYRAQLERRWATGQFL
jgi:hypothetical protein